jgi:hypothetical protein
MLVANMVTLFDSIDCKENLENIAEEDLPLTVFVLLKYFSMFFKNKFCFIN